MIKYVCTGRSQHGYVYKTGDELNTGTVIVLNFKAEPADDVGYTLNELWETKPVLTQAGIEAFVGLIPYPQGFTVLGDTRLTVEDVSDIIEFTLNDELIEESELSSNIFLAQVGDYYTVGYGDDGGEPVV